MLGNAKQIEPYGAKAIRLRTDVDIDRHPKSKRCGTKQASDSLAPHPERTKARHLAMSPAIPEEYHKAHEW